MDNTEALRIEFEESMRMHGFIESHFYRLPITDNYGNRFVHYAWQAYQAAHASQQKVIDSLRAENERLLAALNMAVNDVETFCEQAMAAINSNARGK